MESNFSLATEVVTDGQLHDCLFGICHLTKYSTTISLIFHLNCFDCDNSDVKFGINHTNVPLVFFFLNLLNLKIE